jgi:soluble lytic murein transglycosylase-like protein
MKKSARCFSTWLLALAALLAVAPAAHADWAVLRNGRRLHITGYQRRGNFVILQLSGGEVTLPAKDIARFETQDVFPAAVPVRTAPSGPYGKLVAKAAKQNGLNRRLLSSVIRAESNFHPLAVSPKGALGLMQLMPATARSLAVRHPFDPAENVQAGARYLKQLLGKFGSVKLALAAYNAGPATVRLYHGVPPFRETRAYIARVRRDMKKKVAPNPDSGTVKLVCSPFEPRCREEAVSREDADRPRLP